MVPVGEMVALSIGIVLLACGYLLPYPAGPVITVTGIVMTIATLWRCDRLEF